MPRVLTLLSDFGPGAYVAQMKGAILKTSPGAVVVDLAHDVPAHDVRAGAFLLWSCVPSFADGTVHVAVVDPGVGTERRGLVVSTRRGLLVGPDNGLLWPAARRLGAPKVYAIDPSRLASRPVSRTFHGRDVFAPVAARLAGGTRPDAVGVRIRDPVRLDLFDAPQDRRGWTTRVLHVDAFGNLVTNLAGSRLRARVGAPATARARAPRLGLAAGRLRATARYVATYGLADPSELLATLGSSGLVEVAVREGSAARRLRLRPGAPLRVEAPVGRAARTR